MIEGKGSCIPPPPPCPRPPPNIAASPPNPPLLVVPPAPLEGRKEEGDLEGWGWGMERENPLEPGHKLMNPNKCQQPIIHTHTFPSKQPRL